MIDEVDAFFLKPEMKRSLHRLLARHLSATFVDAAAIDEIYEMEAGLSSGKYRARPAINQASSRRQTILCSATIPQR